MPAGEITNLVNLYTDMQTKMDKEFETKSYTESMTCNDWEWDGNETIVMPTTSHFTLVDYDVTQPWYQRTGNAQQIYDELNRYTVRRKRTFHGEIDEVPSMDQRFIRKMATALKETVDEELVPENDMYRLRTWAEGAGTVMFGSADWLKAKKSVDDNDIVRTFLTMNSRANNMHVPQDGRSYIVSESLSIETRLAERLEYNQKYTDKIVNGQIGNINGKPIIAMPDDLMPAGVEIMMKYNKATADPRKCHKLRTLNNVVGSFATHAEGLFRYDSFVKAHKANGILLFAKGVAGTPSTLVCDAPVITVTGSGFTIGAAQNPVGVTSGVSYKYIINRTLIPSNPKVHENAAVYTQAVTGLTAGTKYYVAAYAFKDGCIPSGIVRTTFVAE
jgi:hypothetical protein